MEKLMQVQPLSRRAFVKAGGAVAGAAVLSGVFRYRAFAADKEIRIGVLYDLSGPLTGAGSLDCTVGTRMAFKLAQERSGDLYGDLAPVSIEGDAQSKVDVAINEAIRLLDNEGVDVLLGIFSSSQAVRIAEEVEKRNKILWITNAISTGVLLDKHYKYVFRPTNEAGGYGKISIDFLKHYAKSKFGVEPSELKLAVIHEDGPYGTSVAASDVRYAKDAGMPVVHEEAYAYTVSDFSPMIAKLRRAKADVLLHTGYDPDITLFLRQARESGLRFRAIVGHGAAYGQPERMIEAFGGDMQHILNVDPPSLDMIDQKRLSAHAQELRDQYFRLYKEVAKTDDAPAPGVSTGFNNTWIFLENVLPVAIKEFGGVTPDAIRQAALKVDFAPGGTIQGYGVKFAPPEDGMAGQNLRASMCVQQYVDNSLIVVWPEVLANAAPVLPLSADASAFGAG